MELETEAEGRSNIKSPDELKSRLERLDPAENSFAILLRDEERYLQTSAQKDGFIIEMRDGSFARHYVATKPNSPSAIRSESLLLPRADRGQERFSRAETIRIFEAYFSGNSLERLAHWAKMDMPDPDALETKVLRGLRITLWTVILLVIAGIILWLRAG